MLRVYLLPRVPRRLRPYFLLSLCLGMAVGLGSAMEYSRASRYLGVFLAGLSFCQVHSMHSEVWHHQMKRVQRWLLRIFFGATIAFEIQIREFWRRDVIIRALAFSIAAFSKFCVAIYAQPLRTEWIKLGTAMTSRAEMVRHVTCDSLPDYCLPHA